MEAVETVTLSYGDAKTGKHGHFRRVLAYLEGLTNRGIFWLDYTPSKDNPNDILTKSVSPADQYYRMRDIINGSNPVLCISPKVKEFCRVTSMGVVSVEIPSSFNCRSLSVRGTCFEFPSCIGSVREMHITEELFSGG
uniref:Uncharacterized protein n=1 Tax=Octactis speculum TaxID=3111310 RepID=A0A7S2CM41_9STRA